MPRPIAAASPVRADVLLLEDDFASGNLNLWTVKFEEPDRGEIIPDPLRPANHVLTFPAVKSALVRQSTMMLRMGPNGIFVGELHATCQRGASAMPEGTGSLRVHLSLVFRVLDSIPDASRSPT